MISRRLNDDDDLDNVVGGLSSINGLKVRIAFLQEMCEMKQSGKLFPEWVKTQVIYKPDYVSRNNRAFFNDWLAWKSELEKAKALLETMTN